METLQKLKKADGNVKFTKFCWLIRTSEPHNRFDNVVYMLR